MKVGADNKIKFAGAVALMAIAVLLFVRMLAKPENPAGAGSKAAAPVASRQASAKTVNRDPRLRQLSAALTPTLDPRLRLDLLKDSEAFKYEGSGRNIFREQIDIPKPVASGLKQPPQAPLPPPGPPPPPPINLKFFGWASTPGEAKAVFLSKGDDVFVAHEGEIVARRYKVMRITPNSVEIQDVLSNNTQSIPLTQG